MTEDSGIATHSHSHLIGTPIVCATLERARTPVNTRVAARLRQKSICEGKALKYNIFIWAVVKRREPPRIFFTTPPKCAGVPLAELANTEGGE
jgi:hypothetical protein